MANEKLIAEVLRTQSSKANKMQKLNIKMENYESKFKNKFKKTEKQQITQIFFSFGR
jgi:hypothetical protein